jgi:CRP/FNR family cyclic AMP-dependent transcriptional regulator
MVGMGTTGEPDIAALLRQVSLFRHVDEDVVERLAGRVVLRQWRTGELLVEQGDPGGSLLVLLAGSVTVYRSTRGTRAALAHLRPPSAIGEVTLLDAAPRTASVEAVEPTEALELARGDLLDVLRTQPAFLDALLQTLGELVRRLSDQAADHVLLDLTGRVAKTLVNLSGQGNEPSVVRLSQSRIAELAGGSRQSLNQVLSSFTARGFVGIEGRTIVVHDMSALRRRAGLDDPPSGVAP